MLLSQSLQTNVFVMLYISQAPQNKSTSSHTKEVPKIQPQIMGHADPYLEATAPPMGTKRRLKVRTAVTYCNIAADFVVLGAGYV